MKFKQWIVQSIGLITTILSVALIYLILFKDGDLQPISKAMLIEFIVIITLTLSTKFFWYTSTESTVRSSDEYLQKRTVVTNTIEEVITDAHDFDKFIETENDANYNRYVSSRCKSMTVRNYKLSFADKIHKLFYRKNNEYYMIRYMLAVERKAARIHKLSGANIRSLTQSIDGFTDDRNKANQKKISFLTSGTIFSVVSMFLTAAIVFNDKQDMDVMYAVLKFAIYVSNILFSILQAILKARLTVSVEDLAYFNKIISILEKYEAYKAKHYTVERVSYIPKEVENGSSVSSKEEVHIDSNE